MDSSITVGVVVTVSIAALGGIATLVGHLWNLASKLTATELTLAQIRKDLDQVKSECSTQRTELKAVVDQNKKNLDDYIKEQQQLWEEANRTLWTIEAELATRTKKKTI